MLVDRIVACVRCYGTISLCAPRRSSLILDRDQARCPWILLHSFLIQILIGPSDGNAIAIDWSPEQRFTKQIRDHVSI
jgi:hypothetical protein